jgi:hypothetical protein
MKFCQVVFILTLGLTAETLLPAQILPVPAGNMLSAGAVLAARKAGPDDGLFFPDLLVPGHESLQGLGSTPEISQTPSKPAAVPVSAPPLTANDRLVLFRNDTFASPGAFAGLSAGALVDQLRHTPAKWDQDGNAYTRRFASEYGQLAARNVIHEGLAGITRLDPRYTACKCAGTFHRSAHALKMTFTTYRQDGRLTLDVPQIAGAYGSGMISTYWYPHRQYTPLVQGVQFGHEQMGEILVGNLVREFGSDLRRGLHLHSLTARSHSRTSDDD